MKGLLIWYVRRKLRRAFLDMTLADNEAFRRRAELARRSKQLSLLVGYAVCDHTMYSSLYWTNCPDCGRYL